MVQLQSFGLTQTFRLLNQCVYLKGVEIKLSQACSGDGVEQKYEVG